MDTAEHFRHNKQAFKLLQGEQIGSWQVMHHTAHSPRPPPDRFRITLDYKQSPSIMSSLDVEKHGIQQSHLLSSG